MAEPVEVDFSSPSSRRRYFLDRVFKRGPRSASSDLNALMLLPGRLHGKHRLEMIARIFKDVAVCLIGAHAVAAYAPERMTEDIDCFTSGADYAPAAKLLELAGYRKDGDLAFPSSELGLFGSRWFPKETGPPIDLIASDRSWASDALLATPTFTKDGDRVMPLPYLVLMKMDAARSGDQFDLGRMLGRLDESQIESIVDVVRKHATDPTMIDDLRQNAEIGRWEYTSADKRTSNPSEEA